MSQVNFLRAWPRDPATGAEVAVRLAGGGAFTSFISAGDHFRAGLIDRPLFDAALSVDENGWGGGTRPKSSVIGFAPSDVALRDTLLRYVWAGARVEVDGAEEGSVPSRILTGTVADLRYRDGRFDLTVADLSKAYDVRLLGAAFLGTGGLEGVAAAAGRMKRRSFGAVFNVEGRLLDSANNIYEFGDPAHPLNAFADLRDKGRSGPMIIIEWAGTAAATLAALIAATPPLGGGAVAPSIACVKWWTQPAGPLTADLLGEVGAAYVETAPAIASRLVQLAGGSAITNLSAAIGWRGAKCGLHVDGDGETFASAIDRLLLGVSLIWVHQPTGAVEIRQWSFSAPVASLQALFIERERGLPATASRSVKYKINQRVHSDAEISSAVLAGEMPALTNTDPTPPNDLAEGALWIRPTDNRSFRFVGRELLFGGAAVTSGGAPVLVSGLIDVQDAAVPAAQAAADAAQVDADAAAAAAVAAQADVDALSARVDDIDDDAILSVAEKVEALIPAAASFEALWVANAALAATAGVSSATAAGARATWLAYLASISPGWNNITGPSPILRGALDTARGDYDAALKELGRAATEAMTAARTPDLTGNFSWEIAGDVAGSVVTPLPADRRFKAMLGTSDVSVTTSFALSSISAGLALTVNNTAASADRGVVTMGAGTTGGGTAVLTATLPGGAVVQRVIAVSKTDAIPPTGGGTGSAFAQDTTFSAINSTAHVVISDELVVRSDGGGNVRVAINLAYQASGGTASRTPAFKAAYATGAGGALTDLFAEGGGSACIGGTEPEDGAYVRAEATIAMPAANTDYYFKLLGRRSSGTGIIAFVGNSFTVRQ